MTSVLIIDDHEGTLETYSTILRLAGFEVATASTGRAGLDLALSRAFDVHLVDLCLPDMSGIDVVRQLKLSGVDGRIVILTVFAGVESSFDAAVGGADGYVDGMLFGDEVVEVVTQALVGPLPVWHPGQRHAPQSEASHVDAASPSGIDSRIREVMRLIDVDLATPYSLAELAARVGLSESGLRHLFCASVGIALTSFRAERRLQVSAIRLTTTYDRIGLIAQTVGLADVHAFRKMFRERFGMSPKAYRRRFWRGPRAD
jgi:YesN/AraC family two-component response regulator